MFLATSDADACTDWTIERDISVVAEETMMLLSVVAADRDGGKRLVSETFLSWNWLLVREKFKVSNHW